MGLKPKVQQRIARALAAWCLVFLIVLAGTPSFTNASLPVRGVADPVVALQMAHNADEVEAILAALADLRENLATLRLVNLNLSQLTPALLDALRFTSVAKWILLAAAIALLATVTIARRRWYMRAAGFLSLAGAALTLAGLFYNSVLVWGGLLMFLGLLLTAATLKELTHESAS